MSRETPNEPRIVLIGVILLAGVLLAFAVSLGAVFLIANSSVDQALERSAVPELAAVPTITPSLEPASSAASATVAPSPAVAPSAPPITPAPVTATPNIAAPPTMSAPAPTATRAANATIVVEDAFDSPATGWLQRKTTTATAGYIDGRYELRLDGQPSIAVSQPLQVEQYRIQLDITPSQGSAGVVFLSSAPATFYHILIDARGRFTLQEQRQDAQTMRDLQTGALSAEARPSEDGSQRLRIERQGAVIQFFLNDQRFLTWTAPAGRLTSQYGFALRADEGQGLARFDNLVVECLDCAD